MRFLVCADYTEAEYRRFYRTGLRQNYVGVRRMLVSVWVIALLLFVLTLVSALRNPDPMRMPVNLMFMLVMLVYPIWMTNSTRKRTWLSYESSVGHPRLTFEEDGIRRDSGERFRYEDVTGLFHSGDAWYLTLKNSRGFIFTQRGFIEGDPGAFGAFVAEKTGLAMKEIK